MRYYVILNGVNSLTKQGLAINEMPPISKPLMRTQKEEIDGRDGDIITNLGYSAYDKELEIGLYGESYDINDIIAFFNGSGTVVFSDEPDKYYNYQIINQIDYEKLIKFKTATVVFHCQPFKYPLNEVPLEEEFEYVSGSGTNITLDNTAESTFNTFNLKGNTSQEGTPTPDAPVPVNVVTGYNEINVVGKNIAKLFNGTETYSVSGASFIANGSINKLIMTSDLSSQSGTAGLSIDITSGVIQRWAYTASSGSNAPDQHITPNGGIYTASLKINGVLFSGTTTGNVQLNAVILDTSNNTVRVAYFQQNITSTTTPVNVDRTLSITLSNTEHIKCIGFYSQNIVFNNTEIMIQLEKGNATQYEPYIGQSYEVNLGKNLFDKDNYNMAYGYTNGSLTLNNATVGNQDRGIWFKLAPNTTYTYSQSKTNAGTDKIIGFYKQEPTTTGLVASTRKLFAVSTTSLEYTFTTDAENIYLHIKFYNTSNATKTYTFDEMIESIQIEKGEATSYSSYFTPIELCKIGDYQDRIYKNGNKWYIEKQIGKVILDGVDNSDASLGASTYGYYTSSNKPVFYLGWSNTNWFYNKDTIWACYCDNYKGEDNTTTFDNIYAYGNNSIAFRTQYPRLTIRDDRFTSLTDFKEWLSTHNTTVYYVLATPTTTEITDTELITQLNALEQANSQSGQTNISQVNSDLPFLLDVVALKLNSDHLIIDNIGNTYAKPTLDLEGTGIVDIYLNDIQMFQVDLSEVNEIVINTAEMEAYNPTTLELANRQVTGDYSNFKLAVGENDLRFSGNLTKATITNYQRWL